MSVPKLKWIIWVAAVLIAATGFAGTAYELTTERETSPVGLDTAQPRFSWKMRPEAGKVGQRQTAYRILVATISGKLREGQADVWDSGKTAGPVSVLVEGIPALKSRSRYVWTVKIWDESGQPGDYAKPAWFETGLLDQDEWFEDGAAWIQSPIPTPEDGITDAWLKYAVAPFENVETRVRPEDQPTDSDREKSEILHKEDVKRRIKSAAMLRREFTVPSGMESARLYICGLGFHRAYINGERAGTRMLGPSDSDFKTQAYYQVHDVTDLLKAGGENTIAVELVNGRWNSWPGPTGRRYHDNPVLLARLEMTDKKGRRTTVVTDTDWMAGQHPIVRHGFWQGEVYDANREQDGWKEARFLEEGWVNAKPFDGRAHIYRLARDPVPGEMIAELGHPVSQTEPIPGVFVYDAGQQVGGRVRLTFRGLKKGQVVAVRYSTYLGDTDVVRDPAWPWYPGRTVTEKMPGMLYFKSRDAVTCTYGMKKFDPDTGKQLKVSWPHHISTMVATDVFVSAGKPVEVWQPDFTYIGFRYFEILGLDEPLPKEDIMTFDLRTEPNYVGTMRTDNAKLTRVLKGIHDSIYKCFHSQFQDNNGGERNSSMGNDTHLEYVGSYWFDTHPVWTKTLDNSRRIYDRVNFTTPFAAGQRNVQYAKKRKMHVVDLAQIGVIPFNMVSFYNDRRIVDPYIKWMEFYVKESTEVSFWEEKCSPYGDHIHQHSLRNLKHLWGPEGTVQCRSFFVQCMTIVRQTRFIIATMKELGYEEEAKRTQGYLDVFIPRITERYAKDGVWNPQLKTRQQTAIGLYWSGLTNSTRTVEDLANICVEDFKITNGHQITGSRFSDPLLDLLSQGGRVDEAFRLLTREDYPSWLNMIDETGGSIRESWWKYDSSNQIEGLAAAGNWWYRNLVGIMPSLSAPAFREFALRPTVPDEVGSYAFKYDSPRGMIESRWQASGDEVEWTIVVPPNSTATVSIPGKNIQGADVPGVEVLNKEKGRANYMVMSGKYTFSFMKR
jgi:alpha-L-rhamnosidase